MLVVTVELFPGGDPDRRREIARMVAGNVSGLSEVSNYSVATVEKASPVTGLDENRHSFIIEGHTRKQSVFALISEAAKRAADLSR